MDDIAELLKENETNVNSFYGGVIELHNNKSLRSIMGYSISLVNERYGSRLYYGQRGFYAGVAKCIDRGSYCEDATYNYPEHYFKEKSGKLVVRSHNGTQEMLHLFPGLKIETIENRIAEHLKKYLK